MGECIIADVVKLKIEDCAGWATMQGRRVQKEEKTKELTWLPIVDG